MNIGDVVICNEPVTLYERKSNNSKKVTTLRPGNRITILGRPGLLNRSWAYGGAGQNGDYTGKGNFDIRKTRPFISAPAKPAARQQTRGDLYYHYLNQSAYADNPDRKNDYIWGAEGDNADHSKSGDPEWDCSGLHHAALKYAGVKDERTTANGYKERGHKIAGPSQPGDFAVLLNSDGHAHHIINYAGNGQCVEARGAAYGIEKHNVANVNARGGVWYRITADNKKLGEPV